MNAFSLSQQTAYFLASIVLGGAMAVIYDLIRAWRMLTRCGRWVVLLTDVLFFFVCGLLTSLFALPFNKGDVRAFILFGEAVGFLTYRLTLGSVFGKVYAAIARLFRHFLRKICEKLKNFYDLLLKAGAVVLYNVIDLIDGVRRTAVSGAATLVAERRASRMKRRVRRVHRQAPIAPPVNRRKSTAYYQIPLKRDEDDIIRNQYDQKRSETRKNRKKNRKKESEHRR